MQRQADPQSSLAKQSIQISTHMHPLPQPPTLTKQTNKPNQPEYNHFIRTLNNNDIVFKLGSLKSDNNSLGHWK